MTFESRTIQRRKTAIFPLHRMIVSQVTNNNKAIRKITNITFRVTRKQKKKEFTAEQMDKC